MLSNFRRAGLMLLVGAVTFGSVLTSCKDNDDEYSSPLFTLATDKLEGEAIVIPIEGGEQTISFETNRKWTASTSAAWLDLNPKSGEAGKHTIAITALPNKGGARQGLVSIIVGGKTHTITLNQVASDTPAPETYEGIALADFINKYYKEGQETVITDEISLQAVLLTDIAQNNTNSLKNITVQAGEAGIAVRLLEGLNADAYKPGTLLTIKPKGAKVMRYQGGALQLDLTGVANAVENSGELRTIEPKVVSFEDIYAGKYENILVAVDGVQFDKFGSALGSADKTIYTAITDLKTTPSDASMSNLSVAVTRYAKFKDELASDKHGRIVGILAFSTSNGGTRKNYNIYPRSIADIQLTQERQTSATTGGNNGGTTTPTPPATGLTTTLADFLATYDTGADVVVDKDEIFEAVLLTDTKANNITGLKNVTIQSGDQGINLRLKNNNTLERSAVLKINAKGATVKRYNGSLQIDFTSIGDAGVEATGQTTAIEPKAVTLADVYAGKYANILVAIDGVQFEKTDSKLNDLAKGTAYHTLTDCVTEPKDADLSLPISFHYPNKSEAIPSKRGRIVGILLFGTDSKGQSHYNLWIRDNKDLEGLDSDRCTAGNAGGNVTPPDPTPTPTPQPPVAPTPTPSNSDLIISAYFEGKSYNKYLQLYNPTDAEIDLSTYSLEMENWGKDAMPSIKELALTGKLSAKSILLIRHASAVEVNAPNKIVDTNITNFSGDDNLVLKKGGEIIDMVGTWGTRWRNGTVDAGRDKSFKRKASIIAPNKTFTESEWEVSTDVSTPDWLKER